jgi:phosphoglycolate phosphatase
VIPTSSATSNPHTVPPRAPIKSGAFSGLPSAILFDIDGTLLVNSSSHLATLAATLSDHVARRIEIDMDGERPRLDGRDVSGWIDAQLVRFVLGEHATSRVSSTQVRHVIDAYGRAFLGSVGSAAQAGQLVPGALEAIESLSVAGVRLAIVTGNTCVVAHAKLEAAGIDRFFTFGRDLGFGDWRRDRFAVARAALRGIRSPNAPAAGTILVGDTPLDIRAAVRVGVHPFGVTTGAWSAADLTAAGAENVLSSVAAMHVEGSAS